MDQSYAKKRRIDSAEGMTGPGDIKKWLRGMSSEQIIDFVANVASKHQVVFDELQTVLNENPDMRKLFVRSIAYETHEETLRKVFEQHGEIEQLLVVKDVSTGKSKGFAFVTYVTMAGAQRALAAGSLTVDGRDIHVHLASEKNSRQKLNNFAPAHSQPQPGLIPTPGMAGVGGERKLFVHGLSWNTTSEMLRREFESFGPLEEAIVTYDKETGKSRGFGFVTFYSPASALSAASVRNKFIDGRTVQFNFASERKKGGSSSSGGHLMGATSANVVMPTHQQQLAMMQAVNQQMAVPGLVDVQSQLQQLQASQLQLQMALQGQQQQQQVQQQQQATLQSAATGAVGGMSAYPYGVTAAGGGGMGQVGQGGAQSQADQSQYLSSKVINPMVSSRQM